MRKNLTYDYIVVGTGPAGAVIAKTLTDDHQTSVLVLESGGNHDKDTPIMDSTFAPELEENFFPNYFWQGEGVPQEGIDDRSFEWTTGRLLGGGSSINGEQYVRPTTEVLQKWERLLGPLWSPEKAKRRFKRLEHYNGKTTNKNARGYRGRISIRQAPETPTAMASKLTIAIERATGYPTILDYNDPDTPLGPFTRWQLYQQPDGRRESSSTAFLSPDIMTPTGRGVNNRKLTVMFRTTALRILFSGKHAIGVEFLKDGKCVCAYSRKKVIISAGINSPQLLMLSGIGPAKVLKKAGIPIVVDNPNVGQRLKNHTLNFAVFTANSNDRPLPDLDPNALYTGGAFLPDPSGIDPDQRAVQLIGIGSEDRLTIAILYLQPKSRGSIRIQSPDPLNIVLADEGFLTDPDDMEAIKRIYRIYIRNIAQELARIDSSYKLLSPTLDIIDNDDRLEQFIKYNFDHNHHQQEFLRMAPLSKGGVVNRRGEVHGVQNLIVADASIVPFTVDGNTSSAAYLIGYTIAKQLCKKPIRKKNQQTYLEWEGE
ncbi:GMC family oxidoreductase [Paenibacillus alvei]|uniref:GMC family oxidoreductase n=1 Tax=Paenibacillus alvei TaxID=44250 RepID=A0ABT4GWV0_PAEAL|nr:GMC family oxidoreductase [Paenibacillus alvei]MCY9544265.1 GMC family oxidoreductase [Paenibacillus alvei]MCY9702873.1 GMC family oxidoreductase [Paenibacillus alvei]MCY9733188.1 GMC family oxidoreductase [Paenibacillus alvei]MCY9754053.1 GMC family oxidoreductase [Paenibacillus alvei]MCY9760899.1 GMC family oxidoreductase [Paenibacillus alvei]